MMLTLWHVVRNTYIALAVVAFLFVWLMSRAHMPQVWALRLAGRQAFAFLWVITGWWLLLLPCAVQAWLPAMSNVDHNRIIDRWAGFWLFLNWLGYGNREDGVSGQRALVHSGQAYMPEASAFWRAYCWSAWRNPANDWNYRLRWRRATTPPLATWHISLAGHVIPVKAGWRGTRWNQGLLIPVFSVN